MTAATALQLKPGDPIRLKATGEVYACDNTFASSGFIWYEREPKKYYPVMLIALEESI